MFQQTEDSIKFNEYQQPIPISRVSPKPGDVVTLSGYGDGHVSYFVFNPVQWIFM